MFHASPTLRCTTSPSGVRVLAVKIALLPGLGADTRMYGSAYDGLVSEVLRVEWPSYEGEQTLGDMAERLLARGDLEDCDAIVGSSLGGMIGSEIVARTEVPHLILLGSAQHPREVNPLLSSLAKFREHVPFELLQRFFGAEPVASRAPLLEMLAEADLELGRAMGGAIFTWEGREEIRGERHRIHGAWDLIIGAPSEGAEILPRAGHVISMTHEAEVLAFIRGALSL